MLYTIRHCNKEELPLLQEFIDKYWIKDHVFVKSKDLIDFQHFNTKLSIYNFFIAVNSVTQTIDGLIGYIPTSQYDAELYDNGDYWGAIWKIRTDIENEEIRMLGLFLLENIIYKKDLKTFGAIGLSNIALRIYKIYRKVFKTGILNQYYILREQDIPYTIAQAPINLKRTKISTSRHIRKIDLNDNISIEPFYRPYKSITFFINRYKRHPIYKYEFWLVSNKCIFVTRKLTVNNQNIIRIIDCLGNLCDLSDLYLDFQFLLQSENAEYIDFVNYGVHETIFENMGFQKLDLSGQIIIPNYFEPYIQKNIEIAFACKAPYDDYIIFKGDSDQDRPNML
jgi:Leucine-rich repeat (LRR) protein